MHPDYIAPHPNGTLVFVWVVPHASRDEIVGPHDDMLKVKVAAPPEGGKANRKVATLVAAAAGGRRGIILDGATSRRKAVLIEGVDPGAAAGAIVALFG
jgi:uncharacterized protein (TIGR00251 family)